MKMPAYDNSFETNTQVKSQDFFIADISKVIGILRNNLYQHKIRTIAQEYMSNARDSHREAGTKKRIIVSIPNEFSPVFKVRDFGVGITPDRMAHIFLGLGASTKQNTNSQTGGFGLGAKSAFSYGDAFTVISITGGVKRTYVAHLGANAQGRMDLVSEIKTTEEQGAEINIAVKPQDCREFREAVFRACYFWTKEEYPELKGVTQLDANSHQVGLKIVDLELCKRTPPDFIGVDDWNEKCCIVIDGIPYPVNRQFINKINSLRQISELVNGSFLVHIGNGVVDVAASRESIADSELTRENLERVCVKLYQDLNKHIKDQFKAVKNTTEWTKTYRELSRLARVDAHTAYGDYKIESSAITSKSFSQVFMHTIYSNTRRGKTTLKRDSARAINLDRTEDIFFVDATEPIVRQNRRAQEYMDTHKKTGIILIDWHMVPAKIDAAGKPIAGTELTEKDSKTAMAKIVKDFNARGLSTLPYTAPVREPKEKRDRTKEMFTMHLCDAGGKHPFTTTLVNVDSNKHNYLYVKFADFRKFDVEFSDVSEYLRNQNIVLCAMTDASIEMVEGSSKFSKYEDWKKNFTADTKLLKKAKSTKAKNSSTMSILRRADEKIKDKHIIKMIEEYKGLEEKIYLPETILKLVSKEIAKFVEDDKMLTTLLQEKYPLVDLFAQTAEWRIKTKEANEIVAYINGKM